MKKFEFENIEEYLKNNLRYPFFKNISELKELLAFYGSHEESVCLLNGPFGTFKTNLVDTSLKFLSEDVLIFRYECFESTTMDDIFLAVFNDLKKFLQQKRISPGKIETDSLSKKINFYLSHISNPAVLILDSFENPDEKHNKEEILSFAEHVSLMKNFKVILISRNIETINAGNTKQISLKPFEKNEVEKLFESLLLKAEPELLEKLYDYTRGNTSYIVMSANIISALKMPLKTLIEDFEKKKITYEDFILQKLLAFVSEKDKKSLSILALSKSGFSEEFLCSQGFFTPDKITYLIEKGVLSKEGGYIFLKSYLKEYLIPYISHFEKINIHEYLKNFYETQLPLKPSQRVISISRNTMREQAAYHESFLSEKKTRPSLNTAYLGYMNSSASEWNLPETVKQPEKKDENPLNKNLMEKYSLTKEELALLGLPVDISKGKDAPQSPVADVVYNEKTLDELLENAQNLRLSHEYSAALDAYKDALEKKDELGYKEKIPLILENCALCSRKMNNIDDSISYLYRLYDFYYEEKAPEAGNEVLLNIAKTYKDSYRFIKAKEIYERFINSKLPVSELILAHSYIGIAEIEEDSSNIQGAMTYYRKAFDFSKNIKEQNFLAEAYFKYALILDDNNQTDSALAYYEKCTQIQDGTNTFISSAYTNIAEIYKERGDYTGAYRNYRHALKYDSAASNYEGIYYLCIKLAGVCEKIKPELKLNFLLKALSAAKRIQDKFYIINSYIEAGDYYYKMRNDEKALKAYLHARKILVNQEYKPDDLRTIDTRIKDLKVRMPEYLFTEAAEGFEHNAV